MDVTRDELTVVQIRTGNPDHYELLNRSDGTRWRVRDGHWSQVLAEPDGGEPRYVAADLVERIHAEQHTGGVCRQGVTCRKLATARAMAPIFLRLLSEEV